MAQEADKTRGKVLDELLVLRCRQGSRDSFDLLARRWQRRLWRFARHLTGADDAAWDATQEAWLAILRRIDRLGDPAWFGAWAYRIVRHKCADHHRRTARQRRLATALAAEGEGDARGGTGAEGVTAALGRLPRDRQELLFLKYREGLAVVEIALVLGIPAGTVKSRLHHAREHLRRILEGDAS